jgi:hypothetical protein
MVRHVLMALALSGVGCGGAVFGGPDGGSDGGADSAYDGPHFGDGGADAPLGDGSADGGQPWSPVCPEAEPTAGSACSIPEKMDTPGILCEYGKLQYDVSCDAVYQCQGGAWTKSSFFSMPCQPDGPNAPSCPATFADAMDTDGGSCSNDGLRCEYPEGVCSCSGGFGGPIERDGGTSWYCSPPSGCPMPRPRLGSSCSGSMQNCEYFPCEFSEACQGGYWVGEFEACAEPGGGSP